MHLFQIVLIRHGRLNSFRLDSTLRMSLSRRISVLSDIRRSAR